MMTISIEERIRYCCTVPDVLRRYGYHDIRYGYGRVERGIMSGISVNRGRKE